MMKLVHLFRPFGQRQGSVASAGSTRLKETRRFLVAGVLITAFLIATVLFSIFHATGVIDATLVAQERHRAALILSRTEAENTALDAAFADRLDHENGLQRAHFEARTAPLADGEIAIAVPGQTDLVLAWVPQRLGARMLQTLAPLRIATSIAFLAFIIYMVRRLYSIAVELDQRRAQAHAEARRDSLTQLGNRLMLDENLSALAAGREPYGLICLDLDGFKAVNDTFGHGAGDELLQQVAQRLTADMRPDDTVIRLGGDEFCILRQGSTSRLDLLQLAARIEQAMRAPFRLGANEISIRVSVGSALSPDDGTTAETLLREADAALYRMKHEHFAQGLPPLRATG